MLGSKIYAEKISPFSTMSNLITLSDLTRKVASVCQAQSSRSRLTCRVLSAERSLLQHACRSDRSDQSRTECGVFILYRSSSHD